MSKHPAKSSVCGCSAERQRLIADGFRTQRWKIATAPIGRRGRQARRGYRFTFSIGGRLGNIKREIRRRARNRGLDLVILDYLTLLDLPTGKNDRRDLAVGRVANEAKQLALSINLAFILLSQLNRKSEDRSDPEPIMSDLRDSGDIEQAADVIIFPFRPIVYDPDYLPRDKAFLKVAKARDLPTGKIPVRFNAEITSFSDWTDTERGEKNER